ncbi:MAG: Type II secretion system F domain [Clostridia bacterium 41_269]|nr:MAG: Type II secretion system F domain [Clostridia bacterium 41_269]
MPEFFYKARNYSGQLFTGSINADSIKQAAFKLRNKNLIIIHLEENKQQKKELILPGFLGQKISRRDLSIFCSQLSLMIQSGIPLISALKVFEDQTNKKKLKEVAAKLCQSLEVGESFSEALDKHSSIFPFVLIKMAAAGEAAGVLDSILERMGDYFEWEHSIREKAKSSLTYPMVVLCVAVLAVAFVVVFILPVFERILNQMQLELPLMTRIILGVSDFLRHFWLLIFLGAVCIFYLAKYMLSKEKGRNLWDGWILKFPLIGVFISKIIISRFCRTLAVLLRGGLPILEALEVVEKTLGNSVFEKNIYQVRQNIKEGENMAEPLKASGVFPTMVVEMVSVGEETGTIDLMLEKVGSFFDAEVEETARRLSTLIEPVLIIIMGLLVGLLLISILLPIFKVIGTIDDF